MAYVAATALAFAQRQSGRYRDGECWTLIEDAVVAGGGRSSRGLTPNFGPTASFVWGTAVSITGLQAGDVVQFANYRWRQDLTVDLTEPDGGGGVSTSFTEETRGEPQHSAMVVRVVSTGVVEVIEQNIPRRSGPVQTFQLVLLAAPVERVTTRRAGPDGPTVTVTTTANTVSGSVLCYRPIGA